MSDYSATRDLEAYTAMKLVQQIEENIRLTEALAASEAARAALEQKLQFARGALMDIGSSLTPVRTADMLTQMARRGLTVIDEWFDAAQPAAAARGDDTMEQFLTIPCVKCDHALHQHTLMPSENWSSTCHADGCECREAGFEFQRRARADRGDQS